MDSPASIREPADRREPPGLTPLPRVLEDLDRAVRASPADFTEIAWIEERHNSATRGRQRARRQPARGTVLIQVREGDRSGVYRQMSPESNDLEMGIRQALAHARIAQAEASAAEAPESPGGGEPATLSEDETYDERLARLDEEGALGLLEELVGAEEHAGATLEWAEGRMAIATSFELRRSARITCATLHAHTGGGPGSARASASARTLGRLAPDSIFARAREAARNEELGAAPQAPAKSALLLSSEAACRWLAALNPVLFSSQSYRAGLSPWTGRRGDLVASAALSLEDDPLSLDGLPFPFDLHGTPKKRCALLRQGTFVTPALDRHLAAELGSAPTAHFVGGDEARPSHLRALPTDPASPLSKLLEAADGGWWVGALEDASVGGGASPTFQARARQVCRIHQGRLGTPAEDFLWQEDLLPALRRVSAVGGPSVSLVLEGIWGGFRSPAWALSPSA